MKITFDDQGDASYIYFTRIGVGGVARTVVDQEVTVALDNSDQIVSLRLMESEDCAFEKRLKYLSLHPEVTYLVAEGELQINFANDVTSTRTIRWDGNLDLDREGQVLGLEMLFTPPGYASNDGHEHLCAQGKLAHMSKYFVPFDKSF
jgi:uncharacterized protein YuzE